MKVALITGANKGLGFETARQLGNLGYIIILGSRNKQRGELAAETLKNEGLTVYPVQLDLALAEHVAPVVQFIEENFGKLDLLINNAGMMSKEESWIGNSVLTVSEKELIKTFTTNFFGPFRLTRALIPLLAKGEDSRILNLSAKLASMSLQTAPRSEISNSKPFAYNASKTLLNQLTIHLAHALRREKIKVLSIYPGWVQTDMGGEKATYLPEEGANHIVMAATQEVKTASFLYKLDELTW
jgi:NAD(P)-dependent dehydrogenase (short-subunit alcohol dehydrogenase family)